MYITKELVKRHLNIDDSFTEDDEYLMQLVEVAHTVVSKHIDKEWSEILLPNGEIPNPIGQAILLYVGNMYANRESISFANAKELPFAFEYLLSLYKDYSKKETEGGVFG